MTTYTEQVLGTKANGTDEVAAIQAWMNYVVKSLRSNSKFKKGQVQSNR